MIPKPLPPDEPAQAALLIPKPLPPDEPTLLIPKPPPTDQPAQATLPILRPQLPDEPTGLGANQGSNPGSISFAEPRSAALRALQKRIQASKDHQEKLMALNQLKRQMAELQEKVKTAEQAALDAGSNASRAANRRWSGRGGTTMKRREPLTGSRPRYMRSGRG